MTKLDALKQIARKNNGLLRPADVVESAKNKKSPLHKCFCWDDTEAAKLYRLDQAQRLIRSFRIEVEDRGKTIEVPAFIGLSTDRKGRKDSNPYRLSEDVAKSKNLLATAEQDALEQLQALKNRYNYLKRFKAIWDAIDKL